MISNQLDFDFDNHIKSNKLKKIHQLRKTSKHNKKHNNYKRSPNSYKRRFNSHRVFLTNNLSDYINTYKNRSFFYRKRYKRFRYLSYITKQLLYKDSSTYKNNTNIGIFFKSYYSLNNSTLFNNLRYRYRYNWILSWRSKYSLFKNLNRYNYIFNSATLKSNWVLSKTTIDFFKTAIFLPPINNNINSFHSNLYSNIIDLKSRYKRVLRFKFNFKRHYKWYKFSLYYHNKVILFYNSFYLINKFIGWYSFIRNKSNINIFANQRIKYYSYKKKYSDLFIYNYNNVVSVLKCYKNIKLSDYTNVTFSKLHYNKFLSRKKTLYDFNFYYKLVKNNKKINYYNYYFNKKLDSINKHKLNNNSNYKFSGYTNDISKYYYNNIKNLNYTFHLDEKYNFLVRNIISSKFKNLKKNNNSLVINKSQKPYLSYKNEYNNLFLCTNIFNKKTDSLIYKYFYSLNIIKYKVFILNNSSYSFFKDFFINQYKFFIYKYKLKDTVINNIKNYDSYLMFNKKSYLYSTQLIKYLKNCNSFFKLSHLEWLLYLNICIKGNINNINSYKRSYKFLYKNYIYKLKKKHFLKNLIKVNFSKNKKHFVSNLKKNLLKKNPYFNTLFSKESIINLINTYKSFCYKKLVFKLKKSTLFKEIRFFKKKKTLKNNILGSFLKKKNDIKCKSLNINLSNKLTFYCKQLLASRKSNSNKYFHYSLNKDINNNSSTSRKSIYNYDDLWLQYIKNKKLKHFILRRIIRFLFILKKRNLVSHQSKGYSFFLENNTILSYMNSRETNLISFFKNIKKIKTNINTLDDNSSFYNWKYSSKYNIMLSNYNNITKTIFFYVKSSILDKTLLNSFVKYKNLVLVYKLKFNEHFVSSVWAQVPLFKDFLTTECSYLFNKT